VKASFIAREPHVTRICAAKRPVRKLLMKTRTAAIKLGRRGRVADMEHRNRYLEHVMPPIAIKRGAPQAEDSIATP
jgi:hypothetical protein